MALETINIDGPAGPLELLSCLPPPPPQASVVDPGEKAPILFVHGAFCSAHDYGLFLPYFASHGFAAYAVSIRGHGASVAQSWIRKMLLTSIADWAADIDAALDYIVRKHGATLSPGAHPILVGHSLGGGAVQYFVDSLSSSLMASSRHQAQRRLSGLVLLSPSPLANAGLSIMRNWSQVDADLIRDGAADKKATAPMMYTPRQVKAAFFGPETGEEVAERWLKDCKTKFESARVGLTIGMKQGEARRILDTLAGLHGRAGGAGRKLLCLFGENDRLITTKMNLDNVRSYKDALTEEEHRDETVKLVEIPGAGHHLMMDSTWELAARTISAWSAGEPMD